MTHPLSASNTSNFSNPATYTIPIFSHLKEGEVSANLWILDSGAYSCRGDDYSYGCIEDEEVAWYNQESAKFKQHYGTRAHHLAFFHIPIPEYMNLYNNGEVYGHKGELVCCPLHNTGFFEAVKKNGDITAMFCGHDHVNNYGGWYEGIELVYGRKTGKGYYGPNGPNIPYTQYGGRVIVLTETLDENGDLVVTREHHVLNQDKTIEEEVLVEIEVTNPQLECKSFAARHPPADQELEEEEKNVLLAILLPILVVVLAGGIGGTVIYMKRKKMIKMIKMSEDQIEVKITPCKQRSGDNYNF